MTDGWWYRSPMQPYAHMHHNLLMHNAARALVNVPMASRSPLQIADAHTCGCLSSHLGDLNVTSCFTPGSLHESYVHESLKTLRGLQKAWHDRRELPLGQD